MIKYFFADESPLTMKKTICINFDLLPSMQTSGSYALLPARVLGISYADYCRMCRDCFGGEIIGKGQKYPKCYFQHDEKLTLLLRLLNKRMEFILKVREGNLDGELLEQWAAEYNSEI